MSDINFQHSEEQAARAIESADAIFIGAGAGMGVDSGLPDFRGTEGFWRAYPPLHKLGLHFEQVADPRWFREDPALAWGFYGHRLNLYRATTPHQGFAILKRWAESKRSAGRSGAFVFTSNVDGHFQRSGFGEEVVHEMHGSLLFGQCSRHCTDEVWDEGELKVEVDEETFRAREPLPRCPHCGEMARPNVLMFGDGIWNSSHSDEQQQRMIQWLQCVPPSRMAVIEMGAGTAIPSVRRLSEQWQRLGATLIRINPREFEGPEGTISIRSGAMEGLQAIDKKLK